MANPFVAMAKVPVVVTPMVAPLRQRVLACRAACASQWLPGSSCSCKSPVVALVHRRHDAPTDPRSRLGPLRDLLGRPRLPWLGLPRLPLQLQHPAVRDTDQHQAPVDNAGQGVPIGMTAPSWKHCGVVRLRSSARRCTSLARTTTPSQHRPVDSPANNRPWCSQQAWLDQQNRKRSNVLHPSRLQPSASGARKPPVSVNVVGPWSCALHGKPSRCGPR